MTMYANQRCTMLHATCYAALLRCAVLCSTLLQFVSMRGSVPCRAVPAVRCGAVPSSAMPCCDMQCHAMLLVDMLCDAMPYHAMPYHSHLCYAMLCYAMLCYTPRERAAREGEDARSRCLRTGRGDRRGAHRCACMRVRPISLLRLSLLRLLDSNFPGSPPWAWEFHPLRLRF